MRKHLPQKTCKRDISSKKSLNKLNLKVKSISLNEPPTIILNINDKRIHFNLDLIVIDLINKQVIKLITN